MTCKGKFIIRANPKCSPRWRYKERRSVKSATYLNTLELDNGSLHTVMRRTPVPHRESPDLAVDTIFMADLNRERRHTESHLLGIPARKRTLTQLQSLGKLRPCFTTGCQCWPQGRVSIKQSSPAWQMTSETRNYIIVRVPQWAGIFAAHQCLLSFLKVSTSHT